MDTALLLAGTSFVGRHLADRLRAQGIPFQATSRTPRPGFLPCDLTPAALDELLRTVRPRWLFQCAGATASADVEDLFRLHRDATAWLLDAVRRHVPEAVVVLFGSAAEYGPVPPELLPIREEMPARPTSPYGQSKLAQLHVAERMARDHGLRVHVVRPFNLLGPGLGPHYFAAALCERLRQMKSGAVPIVNGRATRDWVDVRDVADVVVRLALDAPPTPGQVGLFNLATGRETAVLKLAEYLCRLAGGFHAVDAGEGESRSAIDRSCGDLSRLRAVLGRGLETPWEESLRATWRGLPLAG